jgi:hypothetical protein
MLGDSLRSHLRLSRTGRQVSIADQTIDVIPLEPRIFYGIRSGLQVKAEGSPSRDPALRCIANPHNGIFILQSHPALLYSSDSFLKLSFEISLNTRYPEPLPPVHPNSFADHAVEFHIR